MSLELIKGQFLTTKKKHVFTYLLLYIWGGGAVHCRCFDGWKHTTHSGDVLSRRRPVVSYLRYRFFFRSVRDRQRLGAHGGLSRGHGTVFAGYRNRVPTARNSRKISAVFHPARVIRAVRGRDRMNDLVSK